MSIKKLFKKSLVRNFWKLYTSVCTVALRTNSYQLSVSSVSSVKSN